MEFLLVHCPEEREVVVDGTPQGKTETMIELSAGTYTVTLLPADGCDPPERRIVLRNTTALRPREVSFALV